MENYLGKRGMVMKFGTQSGSNATVRDGKIISKKEDKLDCSCVQMTTEWRTNLLDYSQLVPYPSTLSTTSQQLTFL